MIVLDANILLYAYDTGARHHKPAREYLERVLSSPAPVGLPLQSILAFLRLSTRTGVLVAPYSIEEAAEFVEEWLLRPQVRLLTPGEQHWRILKQMLLDGGARGALVTDAEIAAITMEFGGELQTNDRDFARFPGLRWANPLAVR
ncbi:MAG: type II toxin-antitoxin system VapC family toxin [Acidobacteriota bacterium]|nr:type II toxin-antitoxin system VapC family toxin [Acidobacteriota bacterium]